MAENSLFALLLRSPWWMSLGIAAGIAALVAAFAPGEWKLYGVFAGAPFIVIGAIAGWRQIRAPSAARVDETLGALRAMSWPAFSNAIEAALRREDYAVSRLDRAVADFEATKSARVMLVSGKRWKVARTGVKPLQDLHAAMTAREADEGLYVAAGEVTEQARQFAASHGIRVLHGAELARWTLVARPARSRTA